MGELLRRDKVIKKLIEWLQRGRKIGRKMIDDV